MQKQKNFINDQKNMRLIAKIAFDFKAAGVEPQQVGHEVKEPNAKIIKTFHLRILEWMFGMHEQASNYVAVHSITRFSI